MGKSVTCFCFLQGVNTLWILTGISWCETTLFKEALTFTHMWINNNTRQPCFRKWVLRSGDPFATWLKEELCQSFSWHNAMLAVSECSANEIEHVLCYFITGTQEKKLEGAKVHTEGRPCFYALLWPYKGKDIDLYKNRIRIYFPHIIFLGPSSCLLLSPLCQGDDPLGSIHLRGSVVTAVEFVPDGEWDCCHRKHMPHVASSRTSSDRKIYM